MMRRTGPPARAACYRAPVEPRYLPLLLASDRFAPSSEREPLDRLRFQKGVFLLQVGGTSGWRRLYEYVPWDWGPFSRDLAVEVNQLVWNGLLHEEPVQWRRYPRYRTSHEGDQVLDSEAFPYLTPEEVEYVRRVREYVTSRSFSQLLREVYQAHPQYAVASRFRG